MKRDAFTLIELFVAMAVIVVLLGLAFPAYNSVQNSARKTQAKNDLLQIVTAVNAFYTEYGKYPTLATDDATAKVGPGGTATNNTLFNELRGLSATMNSRQIVFMSPVDVKSPAAPKSGIGIAGTGAPTPLGQFYDPWGSPYAVDMDANYDNQTPNPYIADTGAGGANIRQGVIAWSLGKNGALGGGAAALNSKFSKESGTVNKFNDSADVISWQ